MRLERWQLNPGLITAAELVEAAIVEGREHEAVDAARRLVNVDKQAAPLIRENAAKLLQRTGNSDDVPREVLPPTIPRSARALTRIHPHDPLAWVELSLQQTIRGASDAAVRSMLVALGLAPNNRHVLRSAARLFLHRDDPDHALSIIARNAATKSDPWLMASEIALAQVAERPSRFLKIGSGMLGDGGVQPRHLTELAGAVATEELVRGNRRKSRRSFIQSLEDPTGSSLAQGEWATESLGGDLVSEEKLDGIFENDEARAFHLYRTDRREDVREACDRWSENDPFSVRPFEFGAATAGSIEDFEVSLAFAEKGLLLRPALISLLNAKAFAAASLNRLDLAVEALAKIKPGAGTRLQQLVANANRGLLAFRCGEHEIARARYAETIEGFRRDGSSENVARAKVYLAREAMLAGTNDWEALLKDARDTAKKLKDAGPIPVLERIEKQAAEIQLAREAKLVALERHSSEIPTVNVTFETRIGQRSDLPADDSSTDAKTQA
jgi:tetratricopeptide (TPR) repeat protein